MAFFMTELTKADSVSYEETKRKVVVVTAAVTQCVPGINVRCQTNSRVFESAVVTLTPTPTLTPTLTLAPPPPQTPPTGRTTANVVGHHVSGKLLLCASVTVTAACLTMRRRKQRLPTRPGSQGGENIL